MFEKQMSQIYFRGANTQVRPVWYGPTSLMKYFFFASALSIGGAEAVLVNRLAKQLHIYNSLKYALVEPSAGPTRTR
jgi:hypothetical protein